MEIFSKNPKKSIKEQQVTWEKFAARRMYGCNNGTDFTVLQVPFVVNSVHQLLA